jgi:DNA-binding MarR family transcriptional regulator
MRTAIEPTFGYLVSDLARMLRKVFDQRARLIGLSLAQCRALAYLSRHEGINQAGLADLLEVRPISLARLLDRMGAAGWIERRADPEDRRAHRLYLSEKARPVLDQLHRLSAETRAEALAGIPEEETEMVMRILSRVHANLSERMPATDNRDIDHDQS